RTATVTDYQSDLQSASDTRSHDPTAPPTRSLCERIWAQLKMHHLTSSPFSAFDVRHRPRGIGRPKTLPFPAGLRIVDPAIHPFREEPKGVGHAENDELSIYQRQQCVFSISRRNRHIGAKPKCIELVHPIVITRLSATGISYTLKLRRRKRIERPAFRTMRANCSRPVDHFALAPVETGEMPARENRPDHSVPADVEAARRESRRLGIVPWQFVDFRQSRLLRTGPGIQTHDATGKP